MLGRGWNKFLKDLDLSDGDVIAMDITEKSPNEVFITIFSREDIQSEKEVGKFFHINAKL